MKDQCSLLIKEETTIISDAKLTTDIQNLKKRVTNLEKNPKSPHVSEKNYTPFLHVITNDHSRSEAQLKGIEFI